MASASCSRNAIGFSTTTAAGLISALVVAIAVLFWIPDLVNGRLQEFTRYYGRDGGIREGDDPTAWEQNEYLDFF